jgi:hypothetical protein
LRTAYSHIENSSGENAGNGDGKQRGKRNRIAKWLPLQKQLDRVSKAQRVIAHLAKDKQRGIERGMLSCFREIQNNSRQYRTDPPKDLRDKKLQAFKERLKVIYKKLDKRLTKLRRREERNQMTKFIQNVHASYFDGTKKFFQKINPDKRKNNKQPSSGEAVKKVLGVHMK